MRKLFLGALAITLSTTTAIQASDYRTIDGSDNNLTHPLYGSTNTQLIRLTTPAYDDAVSSPRTLDSIANPLPSARAVSNAVTAQSPATPSASNLTDYLWVWGQFLDHDISLTEPHEPHEPFNIPVTGDPLFTQPITLNRSTYDTSYTPTTINPRQQINQITAFIDASNVYGSDTTRANELRTFSDGKLKTSAGDLLPYNTAALPNAPSTAPTLFLAGDVRANENVVLTAMHTLFVREHNRLADEFDARLTTAEPTLTNAYTLSGFSRDEFIYQASRKVVGAQMQAITYNQFLPALLGDDPLTAYTTYDNTADPGIFNEFSTALYRLGHSLLSPNINTATPDGVTTDSLALRDAFFNPAAIETHGIDPFLIGACFQTCQQIDNQVIDDVRNFLFGSPDAGGFDLASLNIQRGRDHGLPGINQARADLTLPTYTDFLDLTGGDAALAAQLASVYDSIDDVDLWVAALAEPHVGTGHVGQTIRTVLIDQFTALRDGDRFWYQHDTTLHDLYDLDTLHNTTLGDIIARNTTATNVPDNVFLIPEPASLALLSLAALHLLRGRRSRTHFFTFIQTLS